MLSRAGWTVDFRSGRRDELFAERNRQQFLSGGPDAGGYGRACERCDGGRTDRTGSAREGLFRGRRVLAEILSFASPVHEHEPNDAGCRIFGNGCVTVVRVGYWLDT